jgi:hypothetical protein
MRKNKAPFIVALIALTGFTVILYKAILFQDTTSLKAVTINKQVQGNEVKLQAAFEKTTVFMKIKHRFQTRESSKHVTINGNSLKPEREKVKRKTDTSIYIIAPRFLQGNDNVIRIAFSSVAPTEIEVKLANFRSSIKDDIFICFKDSPVTRPNLPTMFQVFLITLTVAFCLFVLQKTILHLTAQESQRYTYLLLIMLSSFAALFVVYNHASHSYKVIFAQGYYYVLLFSSLIIACICSFMYSIKKAAMNGAASLRFSRMKLYQKMFLWFFAFLMLANILQLNNANNAAEISAVIGYVFLMLFFVFLFKELLGPNHA